MFEAAVKRPWGEMNYKSAGSGMRVLLLHDFGQSSDYFLPLLNQIETDFLCTIPDLCGHGNSSIPLELTTVKTIARDIIELAGKNLLGRLPIIAHGTGGLVALEVFRQAPHICGKIILLDTFLPPTNRNKIFGEELIPYQNINDYKTIRESFAPWRLGIRDDYIVSVNAYNFSWLQNIASKDILFVYADRGSQQLPQRESLNIPSINSVLLHWLENSNHDFPKKSPEQTAKIIREYLLEDSVDFNIEEEPEPEPDLTPPSLGELMFLH